MPATWRRFGVDADGDGVRDPMNAADAIASAANYLHYLGAPRDRRGVLFGYNHSQAYVAEVLGRARGLQAPASSAVDCAATTNDLVSGDSRLVGGGRIVAIPGAPGQRIDERLIPDV